MKKNRKKKNFPLKFLSEIFQIYMERVGLGQSPILGVQDDRVRDYFTPLDYGTVKLVLECKQKDSIRP